MKESSNESEKSQSKEYPLVVGIDPSTGAKSALGFSVFDPNTQEILIQKKWFIPLQILEHE